MSVAYNPQTKQFHLRAGKASYVMQLFRSGYLAHVYWGKAVRDVRGARAFPRLDRAFSPNPAPSDRTFSLDTLPQEYPATAATS
ncbi:glycoside hydrolase family 36 N-terminal domain-containing protein [Geobacillus sp. YHL]|uniref:glycoside hydrolase family 36 N-terminal domain-containing protein n=1 Tax=Geobacillus sp. YHL TaxID=2796117 RepID=UPI001EF06EC1|nr:glycoside hydrolase family 36 N-terminal domain-containing protein [Geobacillus sp. YHL]